jgi:phosphoribosylaminoimidazole-succinocarboxamide synthase
MKKDLLYEGKAKKIFSTDRENVLLMEFKDSLTAFNAQKTGNFEGKGALNCKISTLIFKALSNGGVLHHLIQTSGENLMLVHKTKIIPLEVVVRNYIAGSLAKKLDIQEGQGLRNPIVEFYYKNDALNDPFVNDEQITALGWATSDQLNFLKSEGLKINNIISPLFLKAGLKLIDFKVEFGLNSKGQIILADEISPDCMRLWDTKTDEKFDKDRFRRDLGSVDEAYAEVYNRLRKEVAL